MEALKRFSELAEGSLKTPPPLAVKMLRAGEEAPKATLRPREAFKQKITVCQALFLSKRLGLSITLLAEDNDCPSAHILFGFTEPPEWWLEGNIALGWYTDKPEAARNMERAAARFKAGEYAGLTVSPLSRAEFTPDVVLVYCNSLQAMRLIYASRYEDGRLLEAKLSGRNACADSIIRAMLTGECQLVVPGLGSRILAFSGDDELIFAIPISRLESLTRGLEKALSITISPTVWLGLQKIEKLPERFRKLAEIINLTD
ncbi:MAG: hypothetical protein DRO52_03405 [Candidatus Hecatellales archaeon]|nr:MAG: hypothetical protein DRO52_03405 [Candidatus Hecatellales archaeon]